MFCDILAEFRTVVRTVCCVSKCFARKIRRTIASGQETSCFANFRCAGGLLGFPIFPSPLSSLLLPSLLFLPFSHYFLPLSFLSFYNFPIIVLHIIPFSTFSLLLIPKKLFPVPFRSRGHVSLWLPCKFCAVRGTSHTQDTETNAACS